MIRFDCNRCGAVVAAPIGTAGQFATCARCRQASVIPPFAVAPTRSGPPPDAVELTYPSNRARAPAGPPLDLPDEDDGDDWHARRRRRARGSVARRKVLIQLSVALAAAALAVVSVNLAVNKVRQVREGNRGK